MSAQSFCHLLTLHCFSSLASLVLCPSPLLLMLWSEWGSSAWYLNQVQHDRSTCGILFVSVLHGHHCELLLWKPQDHCYTTQVNLAFRPQRERTRFWPGNFVIYLQITTETTSKRNFRFDPYQFFLNRSIEFPAQEGVWDDKGGGKNEGYPDVNTGRVFYQIN